jgi:hypothetical protein
VATRILDFVASKGFVALQMPHPKLASVVPGASFVQVKVFLAKVKLVPTQVISYDEGWLAIVKRTGLSLRKKIVVKLKKDMFCGWQVEYIWLDAI